jgi:hypothetical protein
MRAMSSAVPTAIRLPAFGKTLRDENHECRPVGRRLPDLRPDA